MLSMSRQPQFGFTLAELLIALAILGEIATFTIPKIISAQTNSKNNAVAKETMSAMGAAYQQLQANTSGTMPTSTTAGALTQYMNYVAVDSTSSIDGYPTGPATLACGTFFCLRLHSGALLLLPPAVSFGSNGYIDGMIDPDGQVTSKNDTLVVIIYSNGRVTQYGEVAGSSYTPSWFSW